MSLNIVNVCLFDTLKTFVCTQYYWDVNIFKMECSLIKLELLQMKASATSIIHTRQDVERNQLCGVGSIAIDTLNLFTCFRNLETCVYITDWFNYFYSVHSRDNDIPKSTVFSRITRPTDHSARMSI